jgi:DUF971 family protein
MSGPEGNGPPEGKRPGPAPWPVEVRLKTAERRLEVDYDDGRHVALGAEFLRVHSPSAEVQGHGPGQRKTVAGRRDVAISGIEPVGNYAIRILFDDGHDSGLFTWNYLYELGGDHDALWTRYLAELEAKGLSRDPPAHR